MLPRGLTVFRANTLPANPMDLLQRMRVSSSAKVGKRSMKKLSWGTVHDKLDTTLDIRPHIWSLRLFDEDITIPMKTFDDAYRKLAKEAIKKDGRRHGVGRREKGVLESTAREELLEKMNPRLLTLPVYILPHQKLIAIGSTKPKEVALAGVQLKKLIPELHMAEPWGEKDSLHFSKMLTEWVLVNKKAPSNFQLGRDVVVHNGMAKIAFKDSDIDSIESAVSGREDSRVMQLSLHYDGMMSFSVNKDQLFTRLKATQTMKTACADVSGSDWSSLASSEISVIGDTLYAMLKSIDDEFNTYESSVLQLESQQMAANSF